MHNASSLQGFGKIIRKILDNHNNTISILTHM